MSSLDFLRSNFDCLGVGLASVREPPVPPQEGRHVRHSAIRTLEPSRLPFLRLLREVAVPLYQSRSRHFRVLELVILAELQNVILRTMYRHSFSILSSRWHQNLEAHPFIFFRLFQEDPFKAWFAP